MGPAGKAGTWLAEPLLRHQEAEDSKVGWDPRDNGLIPGPATLLLGHTPPKTDCTDPLYPEEPELETTQMSTNRQMDEQIAVRPYDGYPPAVNGRDDVTRGAVSGARCWPGRGIEGLSAVTQMF